jgi:magnesium transporter
MDPYKAVRCIESMEMPLAIELLEKSDFAATTKIFRILDKNLSKLLLDSMSPEFALSIRKIITYPAHSVGAYMDPTVYTLKGNMTIEKAIKEIREYDNIVRSPIFVLSEENKLLGFIDLKTLITNDPSVKIGMVFNKPVPKIFVNMTVQSFVEGKIKDAGFAILPVVDVHGVFLGVLDKKHILNFELNEKSRDFYIQQAGAALGDLYQIGLSSFIKNTSEIFGNLK